MKVTLKALLAASLLLAPAAFATKIPIPIEGATLNVSIQVQTQALINENGAPSGSDPSYDIYVRRTRLLVNGDISQNFSYLFQIDNALRALGRDVPDHPSLVEMMGAYHNLLRLWSDT